MMRCYRWDTVRRRAEWLQRPPEGSQVTEELRDPRWIWWIDLENPSEQEETLVFQQWHPIHPLTLEDITRPRRDPGRWPHLPKVEEFQDHLLVISNPLRSDLIRPEGGVKTLVISPGELARLLQARPKQNSEVVTSDLHLQGQCATQQLSAILTRNVLITHHYESLPSIDTLRTWLEKHPEQTERGPDYLYHLILDAIVDEYAPHLDELVGMLDAIETAVFAQPTHELLSHLLKLKRTIVTFRKTLIMEREVLVRLTRGEFDLVGQKEMIYYRNVYDHLVRYSELIEGAREMVSDLMQTHLSAMSNRLNAIMKVLTMISTVVLPMTLVAGIYGMNFENIPEFKWEYGYPFALSIMLFLALASLAFFRWKEWL